MALVNLTEKEVEVLKEIFQLIQWRELHPEERVFPRLVINEKVSIAMSVDLVLLARKFGIY